MDELQPQLDNYLKRGQSERLLEVCLESAKSGSQLLPSHVESCALAASALGDVLASLWMDSAISGYSRWGMLAQTTIAMHRARAHGIGTSWTWQALARDIEERGFAPLPPPALDHRAEPDFTGGVEPALTEVIAAATARWPLAMAYQPLALLTQAPPRDWAAFLSSLSLTSLERGQAPVTSEMPVAWTAGVELGGGGRRWQLSPGAMIGPWPHPRDITAANDASVLSIPEAAWNAYQRRDSVQRTIRTLNRRKEIREALASSAFAQRLSLKANASITRLAKGYTLDAGVTIGLSVTQPKYFLLTSGQAVLEFNGDMQRLGQIPLEVGDLCGAEPRYLANGTNCVLRAATPVDLFSFDEPTFTELLDDETIASSWLERKSKDRVQSVGMALGIE